MTKANELKAARATVNACKFGTQEWESAMTAVRKIVAEINEAAPRETFHSVDSGVHSTMRFKYA